MSKLKLGIDKGAVPEKILAISSSAGVHSVAWSIGKYAGIELKANEPLLLKEKDQIFEFNMFYAEVQETIFYRLVANKSEGKTLSKKYAAFDYFLLVSDVEQAPNTDALCKQLQAVHNFLGVYVVETCPAIRRIFKPYLF